MKKSRFRNGISQNERFYRQMNQVMPHWESIKTRLDAMASRLID